MHSLMRLDGYWPAIRAGQIHPPAEVDLDGLLRTGARPSRTAE